jgi:transposase-like protein
LSKKLRQYTGQEKIGYLRRHLLEKESVSKLCDEGGMRPTMFYRWQEKLFGEGTRLFERGDGGAETRKSQQQEKVEKLEKKLQQKDEVLAELMAEYVALKKATGGL